MNERAEKPAKSPSSDPQATSGIDPRTERGQLRRAVLPGPAAPAAASGPAAAVRPPAKEQIGKPTGDNEHYVSWLVDQSMLADATEFARKLSGQGSMWQNPFANPDPRAAIEKTSVWFTAYPISMITKPGSSFLGTLGDPELWAAFQTIGIDGLHTGPVKKAGGLDGLGRHPERRRALRPDQHPDRRRVRHRGRVPQHVRGRAGARRHGDRRHRSRATRARAPTSGWPS